MVQLVNKMRHLNGSHAIKAYECRKEHLTAAIWYYVEVRKRVGPVSFARPSQLVRLGVPRLALTHIGRFSPGWKTGLLSHDVLFFKESGSDLRDAVLLVAAASYTWNLIRSKGTTEPKKNGPYPPKYWLSLDNVLQLLDSEQLNIHIASGIISLQTLACVEGGHEWQPLSIQPTFRVTPPQDLAS